MFARKIMSGTNVLVLSLALAGAPTKTRADEPVTVALIGAGGAIAVALINGYFQKSRTSISPLIEGNEKSIPEEAFAKPEQSSNVVNYGRASIETDRKNASYVTPRLDVVQISDVLRTDKSNDETSFFMGYEMLMSLDSANTSEDSCVVLDFDNLTLITTDVPGTYGEASVRIFALQGESLQYEANLTIRQGETPDFSDFPEFEAMSEFEGGSSGTNFQVSIPCTVTDDELTELSVSFEFSGFGQRLQ